jgi:hypothetical protein
MTKTHEKLLVAVLAGIIIVGAGAFAVQPALASKGSIKSGAAMVGTSYDVLNLQLATPKV